MHMHAHADLELCCLSDVSLASLCFIYLSIYLFILFSIYIFFFIAKVLTGLYFTYVYLLQRPRTNYVDAHYAELSKTFDTPFHLR